jgi:FHS family L-fucose permease-like MFS transporter
LRLEAKEGGVMAATPGISAASVSKRGERSLFPSGNFLPFALVTALFFLWGIPNNLNDVLIRHFMKSFTITRFQAGLIQSAFYLGYFLLAVPAGLLMRKLGYKAGFITGLALFGTGAFLFWPAALVGRYSFFLLALFVIASGLAFLETASNPFIAQCGDPETSERRLNFSQAFNPIGSITGVLVGTIFIFSGIELSSQQVTAMQAAHQYDAYLRLETLRVVRPYVVLGLIAFAWAALIARTKFPAIRGEAETNSEGHGRIRSLLHYRHFILAVVAQFLYVGAQVGTWSYFIQYVQDYTRRPEKSAGYFLTGTFVAFGVGRFASSYLMKFVPPNRDQLLHVVDVPDDFRPGSEGTGSQYKNRRILAGYGDYRRSGFRPGHGFDFGNIPQPGLGLFAAIDRLCVYCLLQFRRFESTRCGMNGSHYF